MISLGLFCFFSLLSLLLLFQFLEVLSPFKGESRGKCGAEQSRKSSSEIEEDFKVLFQALLWSTNQFIESESEYHSFSQEDGEG